jgi:hypothetical protein
MNELKYNVNTGTGAISFYTQNIQGFLDSLIIDSSTEIRLIIISDYGYRIYDREGIVGVHNSCIRNWCDFPVYNLTDRFDSDKFYLNEKVNIIIYGLPNQDIKLILRYQEEKEPFTV